MKSHKKHSKFIDAFNKLSRKKRILVIATGSFLAFLLAFFLFGPYYLVQLNETGSAAWRSTSSWRSVTKTETTNTLNTNQNSNAPVVMGNSAVSNPNENLNNNLTANSDPKNETELNLENCEDWANKGVFPNEKLEYNCRQLLSNAQNSTGSLTGNTKTENVNTSQSNNSPVTLSNTTANNTFIPAAILQYFQSVINSGKQGESVQNGNQQVVPVVTNGIATNNSGNSNADPTDPISVDIQQGSNITPSESLDQTFSVPIELENYFHGYSLYNDKGETIQDQYYYEENSLCEYLNGSVYCLVNPKVSTSDISNPDDISGKMVVFKFNTDLSEGHIVSTLEATANGEGTGNYRVVGKGNVVWNNKLYSFGGDGGGVYHYGNPQEGSYLTIFDANTNTLRAGPNAPIIDGEQERIDQCVLDESNAKAYCIYNTPEHPYSYTGRILTFNLQTEQYEDTIDISSYSVDPSKSIMWLTGVKDGVLYIRDASNGGYATQLLEYNIASQGLIVREVQRSGHPNTWNEIIFPGAANNLGDRLVKITATDNDKQAIYEEDIYSYGYIYHDEMNKTDLDKYASFLRNESECLNIDYGTSYQHLCRSYDGTGSWEGYEIVKVNGNQNSNAPVQNGGNNTPVDPPTPSNPTSGARAYTEYNTDVWTDGLSPTSVAYGGVTEIDMSKYFTCGVTGNKNKCISINNKAYCKTTKENDKPSWPKTILRFNDDLNDFEIIDLNTNVYETSTQKTTKYLFNWKDTIYFFAFDTDSSKQIVNKFNAYSLDVNKLDTNNALALVDSTTFNNPPFFPDNSINCNMSEEAGKIFCYNKNTVIYPNPEHDGYIYIFDLNTNKFEDPVFIDQSNAIFSGGSRDVKIDYPGLEDGFIVKDSNPPYEIMNGRRITGPKDEDHSMSNNNYVVRESDPNAMKSMSHTVDIGGYGGNACILLDKGDHYEKSCLYVNTYTPNQPESYGSDGQPGLWQKFLFGKNGNSVSNTSEPILAVNTCGPIVGAWKQDYDTYGYQMHYLDPFCAATLYTIDNSHMDHFGYDFHVSANTQHKAPKVSNHGGKAVTITELKLHPLSQENGGVDPGAGVPTGNNYGYEGDDRTHPDDSAIYGFTDTVINPGETKYLDFRLDSSKICPVMGGSIKVDHVNDVVWGSVNSPTYNNSYVAFELEMVTNPSAKGDNKIHYIINCEPYRESLNNPIEVSSIVLATVDGQSFQSGDTIKIKSNETKKIKFTPNIPYKEWETLGDWKKKTHVEVRTDMASILKQDADIQSDDERPYLVMGNYGKNIINPNALVPGLSISKATCYNGYGISVPGNGEQQKYRMLSNQNGGNSYCEVTITTTDEFDEEYIADGNIKISHAYDSTNPNLDSYYIKKAIFEFKVEYDGSKNSGSVCGNNIIESGEDCDGTVGNNSCTSLGFTGGNLGCWPSNTGNKGCTFNTSSCATNNTPPASPPPNAICGDGIINQSWEECDKMDRNGQTCKTLGFDSGTLSCYTSGSNKCTFNTFKCVSNSGGNTGGGGTTPPAVD